MKTAKLLDDVLRWLIRSMMFLMLCQPFGAAASLEQRFDVFQVGTTTYRNVTVTTKSKNYVFILHSKGMTNIKVADLTSDLRTSLGYQDPAAPHVKTNTPAAWARQTLAKMDTPQVTRLRDQAAAAWQSTGVSDRLRLPQFNQNVLIIATVALVGLYLLHCYCCLLICRKAGGQPGPLIWVPFLQLIPLLKAASMSPWWILGFMFPGVNLVGHVLLCIKLAEARRKTLLVALLLIFPLSSPFAALYLAFSGGETKRRNRRDERRVELMTLETA
jgi:hypothetical protein